MEVKLAKIEELEDIYRKLWLLGVIEFACVSLPDTAFCKYYNLRVVITFREFWWEVVWFFRRVERL